MSKIAKWSLPALAFAMMVGLAGIRAQAADEGTGAAAAKGKITGIIQNEDGTPAANVTVRLMAVQSKEDKKAEKEAEKGGAKTQAADEKPAAPAEGEKPAPKKERPTPVATTKTDAAGKFELEAPAGKYTIMANLRGVGSARENVELKGGDTKDVGTLKLKKMPKKEAAPATPAT